MKRAALLLALSGCAFAQQNPAITAGIVGGSVGFTACAIDGVAMSTCGEIGGGAALLLGGIAALVTLFTDTTDHSLPSDEEAPPEIVRVHRHRALSPADAGVDAVAPDASPDAMAPSVDAAAPSDAL